MASTYSDLKFELIATGEQSGTWGNTTNTNLGTAIQEAITGSANVTFASGQVTLTLTDTNASQTARNLRLNLTGTSGGAQNLIVPAIEKFYLVNNGCADAITVKNSTGTGIAVPAGKAMLVFNDGSNVVDAVNSMSSLTLATALAVAQGGTGATTADSALTNLGGTTVGKGVFTAASATAAQQAMDTEVGVDVQAYDADLTTIGALAKTDGNIIVGDGANWVAESGATARTSLGLGSIATQDSSSVSITGGSVTGITDLAVADGGTGQGSYTNGQLLIGNSTGNTLSKSTLTAGSGITITDGAGSITVAASGGGGQIQTQLFTGPGTWTCPATTTQVKVTVVGGGGGATDSVGRPGAGGSGGTSSFGAFVSSTGGGGAPSGPPANRGAMGNGTVTTGTALVSGNQKILSQVGVNNSIEFNGAIAGYAFQPGSSGGPNAYSVSSKGAAGGGGLGTPGSNFGGHGGIATAICPVSAPVAITVGGGGAPNYAPPTPQGHGVGGAVVVEWVSD